MNSALLRIFVLLATVPFVAVSADMTMSATAFALRGRTATGVQAQRGIVSADPRILPLGTVIRVKGAGRYSGTYVVADTGPQIHGMEIDIHVPTDREARRFGRKRVRVHILQRAK
jgi:3D (Asp-Asp-Asp) domain-containing protein